MELPRRRLITLLCLPQRDSSNTYFLSNTFPRYTLSFINVQRDLFASISSKWLKCLRTSSVELIRQAGRSTVSIDEQVSRRWPLDDFVSTGEKQSDSLVNRRDTYVTAGEILRVCTCVLLSCDHRCKPSREYVKAALTTTIS